MSETLVLRGVRFTYLDVLTENKKFGNYRVECLLDPDSIEDKKLQLAIRETAVEKWGAAKADNFIKAATANNKVCRKLGERKNPNKNTGEIPSFYEGKVVLSAGRKAARDGAPGVFCAKVDDPTKIVRVAEGSDLTGLVKPVGGNFGDVIVNIWAFEYDGAPQINCTLETIAFREEGEPISTRQPMSEQAISDALGAEVENPFGG